MTDPRVLKSMARIVPVFQVSVRNFISNNPESPLQSSVKLLEMAFLGVGNRSRQEQMTPTARDGHGSHLHGSGSHAQPHHHYMD